MKVICSTFLYGSSQKQIENLLKYLRCMDFFIDKKFSIIALNIALIPEYLTNFNSKMAFIVLINASIYQKFTTYFKSSYVRDISS
ncbi:hypothetical protein SAMN06265171_106126 [Chryseobacterium rhizoplanae]|uniref:Uncharacterized protein n=1 Tax=Chryseobacterium rhizoplanae TaxID=1609531 RepID=A0A521DWG1_9FLAO|nr:hypothetical protein SAMN06265171_106126 [Chryseobacterium rhizoplanae]